MSARFNIVIVAHQGRLEYEALLFAASLRQFSPGFSGKLLVMQPEANQTWNKPTEISADVARALSALDADIRKFPNVHFGEKYPYGNKIEMLAHLPENEPFLFFDTDTLVTGEISDIPFDFDRPAASMRREGTWPKEDFYWPGYTGVWKSLYDKFDLDFDSSLDTEWPDEYWKRYLYFNAGWFFHADPQVFGRRFLDIALAIRDTPPDALAAQSLDPWLDQIALPLVIHGLGGGRPGPELDGLDGDVTCHYRNFSLLYARENDLVVSCLEEVAAPNKIKKILKQYDPIRKLVYHGRGHKARALFDRDFLPVKEQKIRGTLRKNGYWMR